ncbi:hypothetical protein B0J11DRAFT_207502 [Dendryphion nanum]|uniref:Uncharacterized protein n=1 Tax=Dendryphion nanum TaxID=256645 RepID=A0A9P9D089_9PLEO|nr:hypothetical protein B0J11DRAFT_207502 [Dendryphion nanum]
MTTVVVLGTCDTKLEELLFLRDRICQYGRSTEVVVIDAGRTPVDHESITISQEALLFKYGNDENVSNHSRSDLLTMMAQCATKAVGELFRTNSLHGIIAAGGSGASYLASEVMRNALPIGFPKMLVSTVASGDTGPIVGETDITLMYSVVDVAGLNQLLRKVLSNAGTAIAAMAHAYAEPNIIPVPSKEMKRVGITMFGVTTPAVDAIRTHLESNWPIETYIFHATGHGGKALERLVREGGLDAVLDLTTTEICDFLVGGVMSAGPERLSAAAQAGIPNIISVGATDMTNFGPKDTVPEKYRSRNLYVHNPTVTLMRTSVEESRAIGRFIATQLKTHSKTQRLVEVWLPTGGVSMMSVPSGPFEDRIADSALFEEIHNGLKGSDIGVIEYASSINDSRFAVRIAESLVRKMGLGQVKASVVSA